MSRVYQVIFFVVFVAKLVEGNCPHGSFGYLASNSTDQKGTVVKVDDSLSFYETGATNSSKAVIIASDIWGWNSGRTRQIADHFAEHGFYVMIPALLQPALDGGTDGDGLPPNFNMNRGAERAAWLGNITWEGTVKPRLQRGIERAQSFGITKIGLLGFCWGGWAITKASDELASDLTCAATAHPSFQLEEMVFKRNATKMFENVKIPNLWLPAGNDPKDLLEDGAWFKILKNASPLSETIAFPLMQHGWVPRGDINVAAVKEAVEKAVNDITHFFNKQMESEHMNHIMD